MNINELKARFEGGALSKPSYIQEALLKYHRVLFDYVQVTKSTDVSQIRISSEGVVFTIGKDAIELYAPPGDARVVPLEAINFEKYEPTEALVMDLLLEGATNVLDIGANIGWYCCRFAKRLPNAKVFAFEPMPESFQYLQKNVAYNRIGHRAMTFNYGLSDACGKVDFFISPTNGVNASLRNVSDKDDAVTVAGFTLTLDQWAKNYGVSPDFIKCDVEGAELLVFSGGRKTLQEHKPVVFSELLRKWAKPFGYHPNDMLNYFSELGYRTLAVGLDGVRLIEQVTEETIETNYVFLHETAHAELFGKLKPLTDS